MSEELKNPDVFRREYKPLNDLTKKHIDEVKQKADELLNLIFSMNVGQEQYQAKFCLEEAVMWAIKGVTR